MRLSSEILHGRHCVSQLHVHLVFITKYRYRVLDGDAINCLRAIFTNVSNDFESGVAGDGRRRQPRALAGALPAQAFRVCFGE